MRSNSIAEGTSEKESKERVDVLNELIETCENGEKGFREAAASFEDSQELRALCLQYSKERAQFARELQDEVRQLGGTPASSGTLAGALHRGWINVKSTVTGKDEDAIIVECERGEDIAKETYEKALENYLPAQATEVVKRQYKKVLESHNRFSVLKKTAQQ